MTYEPCWRKPVDHSEGVLDKTLNVRWGREDLRGACGGYYPVITDSRMSRKEQLIHVVAILKQRSDGDPALQLYETELREYLAVERAAMEGGPT